VLHQVQDVTSIQHCFAIK